jgi:hypothetical protein
MITVMMATARTSETSVDNYFTRQYIPGDISELTHFFLKSISVSAMAKVKTLYSKGGIAPTHSWPRHWMRRSGQRHPPVALYAQEKEPRYHWTGLGWAPEPVCIQGLEEKSSCLCRGSNLRRPVVQSVARHYNDWATPARTVMTLYHKTQRMLTIPLS